MWDNESTLECHNKFRCLNHMIISRSRAPPRRFGYRSVWARNKEGSPRLNSRHLVSLLVWSQSVSLNLATIQKYGMEMAFIGCWFSDVGYQFAEMRGYFHSPTACCSAPSRSACSQAAILSTSPPSCDSGCSYLHFDLSWDSLPGQQGDIGRWLHWGRALLSL